MTATVTVENLSHRFGTLEALKDIELSVGAGRFAVLLGPSGCGKTTLLSVLGGFLTPSAGRVLLDGEDVTHVAPAKRPTTTMFQDYALFPHMTLADNVGFGLRMRGHGRRERRAEAERMLELVGLPGMARKKPHELSGGQRQRVALARALAVEPDVLLLDEPLGALDLHLRRSMQDELKAIQRRVGTTFVHVTHDQEEAMAIADDIVVMNAGRIEDHGSPEDIYLAPKSLFSAGFMGEANVIEGRVIEASGEEVSVRTGQGEWRLPGSAVSGAALGAGQPVGVCFRPEHVRVYRAGEPGPGGAGPGEPGPGGAGPGEAGSGAGRGGSNPSGRGAGASCGERDVVRFEGAMLLDSAFFGTHHRARVALRDGNECTVHLPQSSRAETGRPIDFEVPRAAFVVLPVKEEGA